MRAIIPKIETVSAIWDFAKYGGAIGTINLNTYLHNSILPIRFIAVPVVAPVSGGAALIQFGRVGDTSYYLPPTSYAAFSGELPGTDFNSVPDVEINSSELVMEISGATLTAGRIQVILSYYDLQPK